MKRMILCQHCRTELRRLFPTDTPYPQEHVKFMDGAALSAFLCDQCGKDIKPGEEACAFSLWADYGGQPYFAWEGEFIKPKEEP